MTEVDQEARDDAYEKWLEVEQTLRNTPGEAPQEPSTATGE